MPEDNLAIQPVDRFETIEEEMEVDGVDIASVEKANQNTTLSGILGHVNFDGESADNTTLEAMASADHQKLFRREVYVGIKDSEQNIEFLGRIVQGPFHTPAESGAKSTKTKTTTPQTKRTKNKQSYDVYGNIEVLGQLLHGRSEEHTSELQSPS